MDLYIPTLTCAENWSIRKEKKKKGMKYPCPKLFRIVSGVLKVWDCHPWIYAQSYIMQATDQKSK